MPIVYAAVARNNDIVAEFPEKEHPKLAEVCQRIIAQVPQNENCRKTFEETTYKFHYKSHDEWVYVCVTDRDTPLRHSYAFLEKVHVSLNREFGNPKKLLKEQVLYFNNPANDKLTNLQNEIDEVKDVMMENIDRVLQRGEKLDDVANKADQLAAGAQDFHRSSRALKRAYCKKHLKLIILTVLLVIVLIIIILLIACNPNFSRCGNS